jgi:hypothetical protein
VPKVARLLDDVERVAAGPRRGWLAGLAEICRGHDGAAPLGAACVHHGDYGTRSSMLLRLERDARRSKLLFADGPPCATSYRDLSFLLHELRRADRFAATATALGGIA